MHISRPVPWRHSPWIIAIALLTILWTTSPRHLLVNAADTPNLPEHLPLGEHHLVAHPTQSNAPNTENSGLDSRGYIPDFTYFDHSLLGRQQDDVRQLSSDQKVNVEIGPNTTVYFVFQKAQTSQKREKGAVELLSEDATDETSGATWHGESKEDNVEEIHDEELRRRQSRRVVWISANTCFQPSPNTSVITSTVPQLSLYVSTQNTKPGPLSTSNLVNGSVVPFVSGYANLSLSTVSDVFLGISAPSLTSGWTGSWQFEVAASTDGYYHGYNSSSPFLYMIDTDSESALFITYNLTSAESSEQEKEKWMGMSKMFTMYAFPNDTWSPMMGLERSFCGLQRQFNTTYDTTVDTSITSKFGQDTPKGQFHVQGLNSSKVYTGFLAVNGSSEDLQTFNGGTVRAGGTVFQQFSWTTKADQSCQVIFDLEFCSTVAYAVPSSPNFKANSTGLKSLYDTQAASYFKNFTYSLAQVACEANPTAQYSLARTCEDCSNNYKAWLCSVLIPRCEDFTATDPWLQPRNIDAALSNGSLPDAFNTSLGYNTTRRERFAYNQSRNPMIDELIQPGPYKELLPCEDLCFDIVRSCPSQLQFACPNSPARELSYGKRSPDDLTCSFPGAVITLNEISLGASLRSGRGLMIGLLALIVMMG